MAKLEGVWGGQTKDRQERLHKNSKVGGRGTEGRKGRGVWKRWGESKKEQLKTVRTEDLSESTVRAERVGTSQKETLKT